MDKKVKLSLGCFKFLKNAWAKIPNEQKNENRKQKITFILELVNLL